MTTGGRHTRRMKWARMGGVVQLEAADVLALRVRQEKGRGVHGTPNCRYERPEQESLSEGLPRTTSCCRSERREARWSAWWSALRRSMFTSGR
jgi:hypothetical protein